ncbi:MAG: type 2 isopentenyl-diphosphate Delta-isomerase [Dichotomicrobium sp.]
MADIVTRKDEHLDIVLSGAAAGKPGATGLDAVRFEHVALPELDMDAIDLSTTFLGHDLEAPLLISSMTGGVDRAAQINANLAEAARTLNIALAVGSQRVALETGQMAGFDRSLRDKAGSAPILANFGAAQLKVWNGPDAARRAVDMIGADALIIHVNPLQEALQPGGDRDWTGLLGEIERIARMADVPIVVKEVGAGISGVLARRLVDAGVAAIDVAGSGGTSWAAVEGARIDDPVARAAAEPFADWGIPTAYAVAEARRLCPEATIIASGGIRHGLDVARAIRLGADMAGTAAGVLNAALTSAEAVITHFRGVIGALRVACFCTGSRNLAELRQARLIEPRS